MKNLSVLGGSESDAQQIPVTLLVLDIPAPDGPWFICDIDQPVYMSRATGVATLSLAVASGSPTTYDLTFTPYGDFEPPQVNQSSGAVLSETSFSLSNADQSWYAVIASGTYKQAPVRVWQASIFYMTGEPPETATISNAIEVYRGEVDTIEVTHAKASFRIVPPTADFRQKLPRLGFSSDEFPFMPAEAEVLNWGYTERTL